MQELELKGLSFVSFAPDTAVTAAAFSVPLRLVVLVLVSYWCRTRRYCAGTATVNCWYMPGSPACAQVFHHSIAHGYQQRYFEVYAYLYVQQC